MISTVINYSQIVTDRFSNPGRASVVCVCVCVCVCVSVFVFVSVCPDSNF